MFRFPVNMGQGVGEGAGGYRGGGVQRGGVGEGVVQGGG